MANDQPIEVLGITGEVYLNMAGLHMPVAFIMEESLGQDVIFAWTDVH